MNVLGALGGSVDFFVGFVVRRQMCSQGPHRICMSRIMICRQQSTITHPNAWNRAFSIIYVFELSKKRSASARESISENEQRRKVAHRRRHVISECAAVCLLLERVCGWMSSFSGNIFPPSISNRNIWQADKRKSNEIISCTHSFVVCMFVSKVRLANGRPSVRKLARSCTHTLRLILDVALMLYGPIETSDLLLNE